MINEELKAKIKQEMKELKAYAAISTAHAAMMAMDKYKNELSGGMDFDMASAREIKNYKRSITPIRHQIISEFDAE